MWWEIPVVGVRCSLAWHFCFLSSLSDKPPTDPWLSEERKMQGRCAWSPSQYTPPPKWRAVDRASSVDLLVLKRIQTGGNVIFDVIRTYLHLLSWCRKIIKLFNSKECMCSFTSDTDVFPPDDIIFKMNSVWFMTQFKQDQKINCNSSLKYFSMRSVGTGMTSARNSHFNFTYGWVRFVLERFFLQPGNRIVVLIKGYVHLKIKG